MKGLAFFLAVLALAMGGIVVYHNAEATDLRAALWNARPTDYGPCCYGDSFQAPTPYR